MLTARVAHPPILGLEQLQGHTTRQKTGLHHPTIDSLLFKISGPLLVEGAVGQRQDVRSEDLEEVEPLGILQGLPTEAGEGANRKTEAAHLN